MEKLKDFFAWCIAGAIASFILISFLVGSLWSINTLVEIVCNIFGV